MSDDNVSTFPPKKPHGNKGKKHPHLLLLKEHTRPAAGAGWGGPPKGAGKPPMRNAADARAVKAHDTPEKRAAGHDRAERLKDELYDIAIDRTMPGAVRVMAADKALDRIEGKAPQTNIIEDRTDDKPVELIAVWPDEAADG